MKKYSFLIGIAILAYIVWRLNPVKIIKVFGQVNIWYFLLAFLFIFLSFLIKIYRWNYLKRIQGMQYKFKESFALNMSSYAIGVLTPGQFGEMSKFLFLKQDGYPTPKAIINIALDRFFDLFLLVLFGFLGLIFFFDFFQKLFWFTALVVLIIIIGILTLKIKKTREIIIKIISLLIPKKFRESFQLIPQKISEEIKPIKIKNYAFITFISGISWVLFFVQTYFLLNAVGITHISFYYIAMASTVARFVTLIPISFLGLGTREGIFIVLLSPYNASPESIVVFSLLIAIAMVLIAIPSLYFWFKRPVPIK